MNIQKFNHPDTVLVISGWPESSKHGQNNYGIAWYTKETVEPIANRYGQKFVILAETNHDNRPKTFAGGKILVLRIFDQKHPSLFPRILSWLVAFNRINRVHVHSEFCTNGGIKNFILLIPFLMLIKLFGKHITYFAHNVITDLTDIAPHLNLDKQTLTFMILNWSIRYYYFFLRILTNRIVVMDDEMKRRLVQYMPEEKIVSVPFWIKPVTKKIDKQKARKQLKIAKNKFVLLYFGFITWYKGADWLIDQVKSLTSKKKYQDIELVLAGGVAWSMKDKPYYQQYYQAQRAKAQASTHIRITGFVPDEDITTYFAAADAVLFPYRGLIGSSGAITHAIANGKPFLMSSKMRSALGNTDYQEALVQADLSEKDVLFTHTGKSFEESITRLKKARNMRKLTAFANSIKTKRNMETQLPVYYQNLFCDITGSRVPLRRLSITHAPTRLIQA